MDEKDRLPPQNFAQARLPLFRRRPANILRIHALDVEACHFGRSGKARFDDPEREFGVFYGGIGLACCVAETILGEICAGRLAPAGLGAQDLADRLACHLELPPGATLTLVDLTGAGLLRLGADARLEAEADYRVSQIWSRALWAHPDQPDGILYRSRYDTSRRCIALFDRAQRHGLTFRAEGALRDHPDLIAALRRYEMGLHAAAAHSI
ncbi:RES family NAD+ phosphorylase [Rhodospirillaceae bacterium SYSU D60014]|uniref:RES family NAD+ phosphorylase n=1 Tax=Virgifigura deserti TaxID=2268457 RepID=UPI000E660C24